MHTHIHMTGCRVGGQGAADQVWGEGMSDRVSNHCLCWIYTMQVRTLHVHVYYV